MCIILLLCYMNVLKLIKDDETFIIYKRLALSSQHSKPVIKNIIFLLYAIVICGVHKAKLVLYVMSSRLSLWRSDSLCCRQKGGGRNLATSRPCAPVRLCLDHYLAGPE